MNKEQWFWNIIEEYIMFKLFYDIEECIETYEEFSDDFPDKSLVIGRDPGGGDAPFSNRRCG